MRIALRYKLMTPRESYSSTDSNNMCISNCSGGSVGIILRISYTLAQTPCQEVKRKGWHATLQDVLMFLLNA